MLVYTGLVWKLRLPGDVCIIHGVWEKRDRQYFEHNFDKFKYIDVIFRKEYREDNVKWNYQHNKSPPHLISVDTLPWELYSRNVLQSTKS